MKTLSFSNSLVPKLLLNFLHDIPAHERLKALSVRKTPEALFADQEFLDFQYQGTDGRVIDLITKGNLLQKAEQECEIMEKNGIRFLYHQDPEYPKILKEYEDAPIGLFVKGTLDLNSAKPLTIVGTRKFLNPAAEFTHYFVYSLKKHGINAMILSGIADGLDTCAHIAAMTQKTPSVAVMPNGFGRIHTGENKTLIDDILYNGGAVVSEFSFDTNSEQFYFRLRNRVLAAMSYATIVIQAPQDSGALKTANLAFDASRPVFAYMPRVHAELFDGSNTFILQRKATEINDFQDFIEDLPMLKVD